MGGRVLGFTPRSATFEPLGPSKRAVGLGALAFVFPLGSFLCCGRSYWLEPKRMNLAMWLQYCETHLFSKPTDCLLGFLGVLFLPLLPLSSLHLQSGRKGLVQ